MTYLLSDVLVYPLRDFDIFEHRVLDELVILFHDFGERLGGERGRRRARGRGSG